GSTALPAEVATGVPALAKAVTCNTKTQIVPGVPDVTSGGIALSTIDFQKSSKSPLGFALATFTTPTNPAQADVATLQNQLNDYLALEAGIRSQPSNNANKVLLEKIKGPKFFLQFQMARVNAANGVKVSAAGTVAHQQAKVIKNAAGASAQEIAQVNALAKQT
ncbi:unnamed protein product, partial [Mycena citricolor]